MDERSRHPSQCEYHSVWQLRVDVWSSIADLTNRAHSGAGRAARAGRTGRNLLGGPGTKHVGELRELVAAGDYEQANRTAEPIARRLVGDSPAAGVPDRHSSEVLVVVDNAADEADALTESCG